ncbi:MAG: glycosyltransferase family 2 protein, partial [Candidatus Daviesbacteria bacterium]|nr:glycosyltransferase family 2 protein [Candidatus Daviesbacteria bacterium]
MKLSVVIPAYNEERNLQKGVLLEIRDYLEKLKISYEVIIVDDGSTDKTKEIIKKFISQNQNFNLLEVSHGGKAMAVMSGMLKAKGDIVLFTDMDQATPIDQLEKFLPKFSGGSDIVIGSRTGRKGAPVVRKLAAWIFSI